MSIATEIKKPIADVFRRCSIRRRAADTALYEASWVDITEYIKRWGSIKSAVDDVRFNRFKNSGITITVSNNEGTFNPESNVTSLWNGYLTRYRTLVKIDAGYTADDDTEYPTTTTQGIFIMTDEIPISGVSNDVKIRCKSLTSVFDEVNATDVAGLGATQTASDLIAKIRDHSDGSGNVIFRQFISSSAWTIQTTTTNYNLATSTSIGSMSCWALMNKLAEAEGNVLLINREGGFEFRDRDERTTTSQFDLLGLGYKNMNIKRLTSYRESLNKYYNYFRLKWKTEDTSTSYVTAGTTTSIGPSNASWKYGQRVYNFDNDFFQTASTAQTIVDNQFTEFSAIKEELQIETKMIPQIEVLDKITVYHISYNLANTTLWNQFNWDEANWAEEGGENFNFEGVGFKILSRQFNLDNLTTSFNVRRI